MPTADIQDNDLAARLVMFNQAFDNGVVRDDQLWQFSKVSDNRYETSIFLRRLIPADSLVHGLGCNLAAKQNAARGEPAPGDERRRYYCGFCEALCGQLSLKTERFHTELHLKEEDGVAAHIAFFLQTPNGTKKERGQWRSEACAVLSAALGAIKLHRCTSDAADKHHPSERLGLKCYGRLQPTT